MKYIIQSIFFMFLLLPMKSSFAQSRDLVMKIWEAAEEVKLSEEYEKVFKEFSKKKTDVLSQIKDLESTYYSELENGKENQDVKEKILKLYAQKHQLIHEIKIKAIMNHDEALFLGLMEHIRSIDLNVFLKSENLSKSHRELYENWFEAIRHTALGSQLKDFVLLDQKGLKISPADLKGKIVWIDSWASKCGPCIKKLKQMKPIYKKFHFKGFEILALSWDYTVRGYIKTQEAAKVDWLKVMNKHKFTWLNVFDDKDRVMGGQFGSVGKNLLIDEKGIIIGFDLHPLEIEQILEGKL